MKPYFSSFKAKLMVAVIAPIILIGAAALFSIFVSSLNIKKTSSLFEMDLFMQDVLLSVNAVVSNLASYIDTKNSDTLRACMHNNKLLAEKANKLASPVLYTESTIIEQNISVLIRRLIAESEAAIRLKRGRNVAEYTKKYQRVQILASFIHERADALSIERLKLNLDIFTKMAMNANRTVTLLILMLISAMIFALSTVAYYTFTLIAPLNALAKAASRISEGDFSGQALPELGSDEICQTVTAFNLMQASIKNYIAEITNKAAVEASLMEERLKNLAVSGLLRNAELKALQSRINPHFLFNTLNAGIHLSNIENADRTTLFLEHLAGLMRYSFRNLDAPASLRDEINHLKNYIYLMSIRFPDAIEFTIDSSPEADSASMPKMIIQPIVENSIQHGLMDKTKGGRIIIKAYVEGSELIMSIEDNGVGITDERVGSILNAADSISNLASLSYDMAQGHEGHGLANVIARLRLFAGRNDVINFKNAEPGSIIMLKVPYMEAF